MRLRAVPVLSFIVFLLLGAASPHTALAQTASTEKTTSAFHVSSLCYECHNNLKSSTGEDVSIGPEWRASIMANASRDPYWQGSVRRESLDHPEVSRAIQNTCNSCHMPLQRLRDKAAGHDTELFSHLPFHAAYGEDSAAEDGVSCAVCHQIQPDGLGSPSTSNGNLAVAPLDAKPRFVFGPFAASSEAASQTHVLTTGYAIHQSAPVQQAAMCGVCHDLTTVSRGAGGKEIGRFPEQMTYTEWLHSDYRDKTTCQQCHMPAANGSAPLASLMSSPRSGFRLHTFTGANFLMERMLDAHRDELGVIADSRDLAAAGQRTETFLRSQAARISLTSVKLAGNTLSFAVRVDNLTGHKLPTSFPSRRAWLHVVVTDGDGHAIFESGKLNPDGSIEGNANDTDPRRFSPHYRRITDASQVEIFEPILGDSDGHVTTGLLNAVQYLKDNRILPAGFDKKTAPPEIAVRGKAAADPRFVAGSSTTGYVFAIKHARGPLRIAAELVYQPIGYRWAHNLESYSSPEPQRFVQYYKQAAAESALILAHAETQVNAGARGERTPLQ